MKKTCLTPLFIGALALTGCNQVVLPDMTSTGSIFGSTQAPAYRHTIAEKRPVQEAFVRLPQNAGRIIEVTEKRSGNGVEQLVVYQGDHATRGQNATRVQLVSNKVWPKPQIDELGISRPTQASLAREMRKVLPGVRMRTSNQIITNAYGPFGYALGRAGGNVTCLYGWQYMQGEKRKFVGLEMFNPQSKKPELSLRVRVCREGASRNEMVDLMRQIRIEADPETVLARKSVSWSSGPKDANASLAMPSYEAGGYQSETVLSDAVEQPVIRRAPAKRKKVVRRKAKTRTVYKRADLVVRTSAVEPKRVERSTAFMPLPVPTSTASVQKPLATKKTLYKSPMATNQAYPAPTYPTKVQAPVVVKRASTGPVPLPN